MEAELRHLKHYSLPKEPNGVERRQQWLIASLKNVQSLNVYKYDSQQLLASQINDTNLLPCREYKKMQHICNANHKEGGAPVMQI